MKIREITEVGFYRAIDDTIRETLFEIVKNEDEEWLKEDPEATLLLDTWIYDYTDENDRRRYFNNLNMSSVYLDESVIDVVKIEDMNYRIFGGYGQYLIEDKPTYKEQIKELQEKLEIAKEALQYYADGEEMSEARIQGSDAWRYVVDDNYGHLAYQALQKIKGTQNG